MQHYQLDPRRYYPDAQEQSILIPYLRKYFNYPERSPERNRIASEVSQMLLKFSPHWTHRAVRLWFNNNRLTYLKSDSLSQSRNPNQQGSDLSIQNAHKQSFNDLYITPTKQAPNLYNKQFTLPSIESLVSSSSIPTMYSGTSSLDEISSIVGSQSSNSLQDSDSIISEQAVYSLIHDSNLYTNNIEKIRPCISKLTQIFSNSFNLQWPIKFNVVEFPPRQFSLDLSCLLNNENQIWQNRKFTDEILPKIDLYLTEQKIDSYIVNNICYFRKDKKFIQVTDKIPTAIIRYTTSNNCIWTTTESKEIYKIDIGNQQDHLTQSPQIVLSSIENMVLPTSCSNSSLSSSDSVHAKLTLPLPVSQMKLVPFDDFVLIYANESPTVTITTPDMKMEDLRLQLLSCPLSVVKVKDDRIVYGMKNTMAFAMNDISNGQLIRHFIGHSKPINQLHFFNSNLLVSAGKDGLVRLWDIRNEDPVMTIRSTRKSCKGITGNEKALITCFDESVNSCVNVADLRTVNNYKPLLAFELDNANPMTINYNIKENSLNLFLIQMRPQVKINYMYRTYENLLS